MIVYTACAKSMNNYIYRERERERNTENTHIYIYKSQEGLNLLIISIVILFLFRYFKFHGRLYNINHGIKYLNIEQCIRGEVQKKVYFAEARPPPKKVQLFVQLCTS